MEWLKRLPVIGPVVSRAMRTHAWRAYERLDAVRWSRLAAALTFKSFLTLFPLIAVMAAVAAALLGKSGVHRLSRELSKQVPGIGSKLDLDALLNNAGTVGGIAGALLLYTGIGWVAWLRECLRAVWRKEEDPGNPVLLKLTDGGALLGLGAVGLVAMAGSAFASSAVGWVADRMGLAEGSASRVLLVVAGVAIAVTANFLLLVYLLTRMPRVHPDRRSTVVAALIGAVGFEVLKLLLSGYLRGVAAKSMYGAFGVPIALLLWINFMVKLLLYCSAWTAVSAGAQGGGEGGEVSRPAAGDGDGRSSEDR
ncbi:YihY/virulence factor BrkB family protein [Streptomyces sp. TP-A0874]|uniref:YihY/virulence factor BrkB family protein n=1 Tax=Streptomyces sp. TP-A0874 TaxID=549819 RepID=UPI000852CC81|nr:YihY/virulence factor BrkB family protein [Streptomyces sp. TP-A0874]